MKARYWIIIMIIVAVGALVCGYFLGSRRGTDPGGTVVIADPGETSPTEPNKPGDKPPAFDCGNIWIEGGMLAGNRFGVTAGDGYNHAERIFGLGVVTPPKHWHIIQLSYAPVFNLAAKQFRHNLDAMYFYSWEHVAVGAGVAAIFDKTQLCNIGPKIGIQARIEAK